MAKVWKSLYMMSIRLLGAKRKGETRHIHFRLNSGINSESNLRQAQISTRGRNYRNTGHLFELQT